jgi:hypothetical protein
MGLLPPHCCWAPLPEFHFPRGILSPWTLTLALPSSHDTLPSHVTCPAAPSCRFDGTRLGTHEQERVP